MIVLCSYCQKFIKEKKPLDDKRISHSICKECYDEILKKEELDER